MMQTWGSQREWTGDWKVPSLESQSASLDGSSLYLAPRGQWRWCWRQIALLSTLHRKLNMRAENQCQKSGSWKGLLGIIWSNPPARAGCTVSYSGGFWTFPEMQTPQQMGQISLSTCYRQWRPKLSLSQWLSYTEQSCSSKAGRETALDWCPSTCLERDTWSQTGSSK